MKKLSYQNEDTATEAAEHSLRKSEFLSRVLCLDAMTKRLRTPVFAYLHCDRPGMSGREEADQLWAGL